MNHPFLSIMTKEKLWSLALWDFIPDFFLQSSYMKYVRIKSLISRGRMVWLMLAPINRGILYMVTLTFMYFTSISVFFSSSMIISLWNLLNCGEKTHTSFSLQHTSSCMHAVPNTMYSSGTWLVTIRAEWPGGMHDNGFLRGWDSTHKGWLIGLLRLKIYNFSLLQRNYNQARTFMRKLREMRETFSYTEHIICIFGLVLVCQKCLTSDWALSFSYSHIRTGGTWLQFTSCHLQVSETFHPEAAGSEKILCFSTLVKLYFTFCYNNFELSKVKGSELRRL